MAEREPTPTPTNILSFPIINFTDEDNQFKKEQNFFDFFGRPDYMIDEAYGVNIGGDVRDKPVKPNWKNLNRQRWRSGGTWGDD